MSEGGSNRPALVVIDVQQHLLSLGVHDGDGVVERIASLVRAARDGAAELVFVQHEDAEDGPMAPGSVGWEFHPAVRPTGGEPVVHKRASDAFFETDLDSVLKERGVTRLFIVGCMTEYCIDTSSRRATTLGYDVTLVSDCHTTSGNDVLDPETVIRHHNATLDEFGNDEHEIAVVSSSDVDFTGGVVTGSM